MRADAWGRYILMAMMRTGAEFPAIVATASSADAAA